MKPDVKIEIIYYGEAADWAFESGFYGKDYALRLLTQTAANPSAFLKALDRAVSRSAVILVVGDLADTGRTGLCSLLARAVGMDYLPDGGLPEGAVAFDGGNYLRGGRMESGGQVIYLLHGDKDDRDRTLREHIFPELSRRFSVAIGGVRPPVTEEKAADGAEDTQAPGALPARTIPRTATSILAETSGRRRIAVRLKKSPVAAPQTAASFQAEPSADAPDLETNALADVPSPVATDDLTPVWDIQPKPAAEEANAVTEARPVNETDAKDTQEEEAQPHADEAVFFGFDTYEPAGRKPKKRLAIALTAILLSLALVAGGCFGYINWFQPWQTDRVYTRMSGLYGKTGEGALPPSASSAFGALYDENPDIAGWLTLPNTSVNYPVAAVNQNTAGYYESHLFDGTWNHSGTLYTGCVPLANGYYRNMTIYGKDLGDGRMLSDLQRYLELSFYQSSPLLTMDTLYTKGQWKIFSVFRSTGEDPLDYNQSVFSDDTAFLTYIAALADRSAIRTAVDLRADDEILTLVAKGDDGSVVLAARKVRPGESIQVNTAAASVNPDPVPVAQPVTFSMNALLGRFGLLGTAAAAEAPQNMNAGQTVSQTEADTPSSQPVPTSSQAEQPAEQPAELPAQAPVIPEEPVYEPPAAGENYPAAELPAGEDPVLTVRNQFDQDRLLSAPASEIIAGVVEAEMGPSYEMEALKAQAVAAYSWMLCNGAADGKNPRVYWKTPSDKVMEAVKATQGQRALYGDAVACTYYYAISAGRTALPSDIWGGGNQPYLVSVDSSVDVHVAKFETKVTYRAPDVAGWIKDVYGVDVSSVDKNSWFHVTYDDYGVYARSVLIGGALWVRAPSLRNDLFTSSRAGSGNGLRSSAYTVAYDADSDCFTFTVRGYGHGVGMSQTGANEYAKQGWSYEQILQHYFTGITVG